MDAYESLPLSTARARPSAMRWRHRETRQTAVPPPAPRPAFDCIAACDPDHEEVQHDRFAQTMKRLVETYVGAEVIRVVPDHLNTYKIEPLRYQFQRLAQWAQCLPQSLPQ